MVLFASCAPPRRQLVSPNVEHLNRRIEASLFNQFDDNPQTFPLFNKIREWNGPLLFSLVGNRSIFSLTPHPHPHQFELLNFPARGQKERERERESGL